MMKKWIIAACMALIASAISFTACKKTTDEPDDNSALDRKAMLTNYADNYILPGYAAMTNNLATYKAKVDAFAAAPDNDKFKDLKGSIIDVYNKWQEVDMLEFGPAADVSLRMYINIYPVTTSKIESNISSGSYNLEEFGNKDAQGFPALDYLLNARTLADYTTDANAQARRKYLQDVTNKMLEKVQAVKTGWDSYRNTFINATGTDANSGTSQMVNAFVLYYERYFRSAKIGLPVGAMTGVAKPELVESYYSPQFGNGYARRAMLAIQSYYEGTFQGAQWNSSMKSYMKNIGTKDESGKLIADLISEEMTQADTKLQGLNVTLHDAVQNNRTQVLDIYDAIQDVVPLLKVDMVSAMGISITYVDNDGD